MSPRVSRVIIGEGARRALTLFGALVLAGCSSSSVPALPSPTGSIVVSTAAASVSPSMGTSQTPAASLSESPSMAAVERPVLPAAAEQADSAGAESFFRYFWDTYNYAFDALDAAPLQAVSDSDCKYCSNAVAAVSKAKAGGFRFRGGSVSVLTVVAAPGAPEDGVLVNAAISQSESETLARDGTVKASSAASSRRRADAVVRWSSGSWRLIQLNVTDVG